MRRLAGWVVLVALGWFAFKDPAAAAHATDHAGGLLGGFAIQAGHSLTTWIDGL